MSPDALVELAQVCDAVNDVRLHIRVAQFQAIELDQVVKGLEKGRWIEFRGWNFPICGGFPLKQIRKSAGFFFSPPNWKQLKRYPRIVKVLFHSILNQFESQFSIGSTRCLL